MKALLTLDFAPEPGGIQRYLSDIVKTKYATDDYLLVGSPHAHGRQNQPAVRWWATTWILSHINKKFSLVPMLIAALVLRLRHRDIFFECGNVYTAGIPWIVNALLPTRYAVYTYGTELIALPARPLHRFLFKRVLNRAAQIYALGDYTRTLLTSLSITRPIDIIPPRIILDDAITAQSIQQSLSKKASPPMRLLSIGRLVEHKGHAILIKAMETLRDDSRWTLTIIGNGPLLPNLCQQIKDCGLADRITINPDASDDVVASELSRATIFIHPSLQTNTGTEGFGIVLLEAMAHGVAIIAGNCGGIPEVVGHGSCGVLIPQNNPDALATATIQLMDSPEKRLQLALAGLDRVQQHYSLKSN